MKGHMTKLDVIVTFSIVVSFLSGFCVGATWMHAKYAALLLKVIRAHNYDDQVARELARTGLVTKHEPTQGTPTGKTPPFKILK